MKWVNYLKELPRLGNTFSLFSRPNFFSDEKRNPLSNSMMLGESFISLWFGGEMTVTVSSSFCAETAGFSWELKTESNGLRFSWKKKTKTILGFSAFWGLLLIILRKEQTGLVKSSEYLQERYRLQEKLFLYLSILLRNVGYHLLPRWLTAPLLCSLNT